jgi:hypothetical protein
VKVDEAEWIIICGPLGSLRLDDGRHVTLTIEEGQQRSMSDRLIDW